jgi:LDH2 family malate/lactate/ureidoglycolate dehydrogenase
VERVAADRLLRLVRRAFLRRGLSEEHAAWVAEALVETSLRGSDTHGVRLAPTLLAELEGGRSKPRPEMVWHGTASAVRKLDADAALGIVAGRAATAEVIRLAREHGSGTVAVRNSNYFASAATYSLAMARQGLAGLAFTNSDALVAPHGGIAPFFGTNPFSFAMRGEAEGDLLCIDMATSQIAFSRIRERRLAGQPLERGWAVTADGRDAAEAGGGPRGRPARSRIDPPVRSAVGHAAPDLSPVRRLRPRSLRSRRRGARPSVAPPRSAARPDSRLDRANRGAWRP